MKSLTIISVLLAVVALGVLIARYGRGFSLAAPPPTPPPAQTEGEGLSDVGPVVRLEPFVMSDVNDDGEHMSTVTFEVEVNDVRGRDLFKARTSEIRSAILNVLADAKLSDIGDPEDLTNLKKRVQTRIEAIVPDQVVRRVLITEFLTL